MKKLYQFIIGSLIIASITTGAWAVVKTYVNETNILNIYNSLTKIEAGIDKLDAKLEKLR